MKDFTVEQLNEARNKVVDAIDNAVLVEHPDGSFVLTSDEGSVIGEGHFADSNDLAKHLFKVIGITESPLLDCGGQIILGSLSPILLNARETNVITVEGILPWRLSQETANSIVNALTIVWRGAIATIQQIATGSSNRLTIELAVDVLADQFRIVVSQMLILHYVEIERYQLQLADHAKEQKRSVASPIGVQPEGNWPRDEGQNVNDPKRKFLTERSPLDIPPRPNGPEHHRQMAIHRAMQGAGKDIDSAIDNLSERVEQLPNEGDLDKDPAVIALAVLSKHRAAERRRIVNRRINLGIFFFGLVTIVSLLVFFGRNMVTTGRNTIVFECSVPYGDDRLTAERFQSYSFKELFGFQQIDKASITEVTKLKLTGDDLIILGVDPKDNKPWRMDFAKGEFGNPPLKPTDLYWFVGGRGKASPVSYKAFCH